MASLAFDDAAAKSAAVVGTLPLLLLLHSLNAPANADASFLRCVFLLFLCSAGTAKKTINIIRPAIANTIRTSMIEKPF